MTRRLAALVFTAVVVTWTFAPVRHFAFLNWDDDAVIVDNAALSQPGLGAWAFTTRYMEHYQPLSWLLWGAVARAAGSSATAFHTLNLAAHAASAVLLFAVALAVLRRTAPRSPAAAHEGAALAAALLFALHPLQIEVVAWVSALPYAVALALMLLSLLVWLTTSTSDAMPRRAAALALYGASLLARPIALGFPIVLAIVDLTVHRRAPGVTLRRVWPFAFAAIAGAIAETLARAPVVSDAPWSYRLQLAAAAPFVHLWRTLTPLPLIPLDLLPESPRAAPWALATALVALAALLGATWRWRRAYPAAGALLLAYLALLAPAAGLMLSGLQRTADRYGYLPGTVVMLAVAALALRWTAGERRRQSAAAAAGIALVIAATVTTRQALPMWSDSIALWSHAVQVDGRNHVARYNLGAALAAAGRADEAAAHYREVLSQQPGHAQARANLDRLDAARLEEEGNAAAAAGDLRTAAERYRHAVLLDPLRIHAQAGLGMALAAQGHSGAAIGPLRAAIQQGNRDVDVANTLALLLLERGDLGAARQVLQQALAANAADVGLTHNLARLLATAPGVSSADAALALRLAEQVVQATDRRDPRTLDTLAAALAANGRLAEAASVSARAAALAEAGGDHEMAVQITARGRAYRRPGQ